MEARAIEEWNESEKFEISGRSDRGRCKSKKRGEMRAKPRKRKRERKTLK